MSKAYAESFPQDTFKEHITNWGGVQIEIIGEEIFIHFVDNHNFPFELPESTPDYGFYDGTIRLPLKVDELESTIEKLKTVIDLGLARGQEQKKLGLEIQKWIIDALIESGLEVNTSELDRWLEG